MVDHRDGCLGELLAADAEPTDEETPSHRHAEVGAVQHLVGEVEGEEGEQAGDQHPALDRGQAQAGDRDGEHHRKDDRPK